MSSFSLDKRSFFPLPVLIGRLRNLCCIVPHKRCDGIQNSFQFGLLKNQVQTFCIQLCTSSDSRFIWVLLQDYGSFLLYHYIQETEGMSEQQHLGGCQTRPIVERIGRYFLLVFSQWSEATLHDYCVLLRQTFSRSMFSNTGRFLHLSNHTDKPGRHAQNFHNVYISQSLPRRFRCIYYQGIWTTSTFSCP